MAAVASAAVCLLVWSAAPRVLSGPIDVVGYPAYYNHNHHPPFWAYRLVVFAFPVLLVVFQAVLGRRGPLRRTHGQRPREPIRMVALPDEPASTDRSGFRLSVVARVVLPLGVVLVAVGGRDGRIRGLALACGLVYLLGIVAAGMVWGWARSRAGARTPTAARWHGIALANGVGGATAALLGLWFVSRHTAAVEAGGERAWPWLPLWIPLVGIALVLYWTRRGLRRGSSARAVERLLLIAVVGPTAVFLATSYLPPPVHVFRGHFDDSQTVAGANLLSEGHLPWRDLIMIHGVLPDILRGSIGFAVFDNSVWGASAAGAVLLYPLGAVFLYLYAAWVSRGNPWFLALVSAAVIGGVYPFLDGRFLLVPVALVLLGETLRRQRGIWCVALVLLLFVQAVLVPETGLLVLPALACVVAADLVHREPGASVWLALRRTRWCVATGAIATLLFGLLLAWYGALSAFVTYYVIFVPGHNESGALPIGPFVETDQYVYWAAGIIAVLVTAWATVVRISRRADWEPLDWVAVAAAASLAVYGEKALGRFDGDHVQQVFAVAVPLILLILWKGLRAGDLVVTGRPASRWMPRGSIASGLAAVVLLAYSAVFFEPLLLTARTVENRHRMTASEPTTARLGYAERGVVDPRLIADLGAALRAYAGDDEPVFDMTNSPGYVYHLLNRRPGTRFAHVSMAITPSAQRLLIQELKRSQPPVIVFDATHMGAPHWDEIPNNVRHHLLSQYVLDRWQPVLKTHGNLILLRRDLVARGLPIPSLSQPPATAHLWFSGPGCRWGAAPNFLPTAPGGATAELSVRPVGERTLVDIRGWAHDEATGRPASAVVLVVGRRVVSSVTLAPGRPEVTEVVGAYASSTGFRFSGVLAARERPTVFALTEDGALHPVGGAPGTDVDSVEFPDGRVMSTVDSAVGSIDIFEVSQMTAGAIEVPATLDVAAFDLATLSTAGGPFGAGQVVITDDIGPGQRFISATSLTATGAEFAIRIGSCLQLRGYDTARPLYVLTDGAAPVRAVALSGVRDSPRG